MRLVTHDRSHWGCSDSRGDGGALRLVRRFASVETVGLPASAASMGGHESALAMGGLRKLAVLRHARAHGRE